MKFLFKHWPLLFILAVWFIFAHPYFLFGKVPFPSGYLVNFFAPWNTVSEFAGPFKNGATPDVITQIYPWKNLVIDMWKHGVVPLWNPYSFSGTPLLANYQSAALSPFNILYFILPFIDAWSITVLLQPLLAGIFTYIYIRSLKLTKSAALFSAIAFMFCGFITTWMSYATLGFAILFLPLALFSIEKFYELRHGKYLLILSACIPLSFLSGHFQTSLYFSALVLFYLLFKSVFFESKNKKLSVLQFLSIVFGLFISAPQILPSIELYAHSVRSEIFSAVEIIPWSYLPTFLAPDFYGNPVTRNDWIGHYAEWNGYIGVISLILASYSFSFKKFRKIIIFYIIVGFISMLLAFDSPLLNLLINLKVPVISTSAASRIIVLTGFSFSVLSAFGFDKIIQDIRDKKYKYIFLFGSAFGFIFFILWIGTVLTLFIPAEKTQIAFSNLKLPTLIIIIYFGLLMSTVFVRSKKYLNLIPIFLILILAFDLLRFATKWQPFEPRKFVYPTLPISEFVGKITPYDRVLGNFGAEFADTYKASYIEGYDPLYISRYGEFIAASQDGKYHKAQRSAVVFPKKGAYSQDLISFLGVKYIIHKIADGRYSWAYPFWEYPVDYFTPVYKDTSYEVYQNQKAFNRAFIVGNYQVEKSDTKLLNLIFNKNTNLKDKVFLEENVSGEFPGGATGEAVIKSYGSNKITIESSSSGSALLVLTDPFYPGWKAYVDGRNVKIYRADYVFRSVVVPSGKHMVSFIYDPDSFKQGLLVSVFGIVGTIFLAFYYMRKVKV